MTSKKIVFKNLLTYYCDRCIISSHKDVIDVIDRRFDSDRKEAWQYEDNMEQKRNVLYVLSNA